MAEWFKAAVLKTAARECRGFESLLLRCLRFVLLGGEMAELVEGARLLSECMAKSCTEGSNPSLSAGGLFKDFFCAPIAQLDRAVVYGTTGQRFESSWAYPDAETKAGGAVFGRGD